MATIAHRRPLLLGPDRRRSAIAATLGSFMTWLLLLTSPVHALDPNKYITQYIHTSWRTQDGSAPAGMFGIAQTSDGSLWFSAIAQGVYRFDGVRFLRPFANSQVGSIHIDNVVADQAGG